MPLLEVSREHRLFHVQIGAQLPDHQPERPVLLLRAGAEPLEGDVQGHPLEAHRLQECSRQS